MTILPPTATGTPFEHHTWEAFTAVTGPSHVSLDWVSHTQSLDNIDTTPETMAYSASHTPADALLQSPFILNTSAMCHISSIKSDFKALHPIALHPITSIGGAHVHATGLGSIELCIASGHKVVLEDVLYVPTSTIRLVSILCLNHSGGYTSSFNGNSCWVTNTAGATVLQGTIIESRHLFSLTLQSPHIGHICPTISENSTHYTARTPNLETWHQCLGHCNNEAIIDIACKNAVQDMHIDLSSTPPCCNHCILGKQTRLAVPKVQEGDKATCPLERVFIDLCGPMPCCLRSGHLYSMNIIDDFSSYTWSLPLRNKEEAASIFQSWHCAVENQSGHHLKILISDNGELISKSMQDWADLHGINHQRTAPYTSAHNGHAKHLH